MRNRPNNLPDPLTHKQPAMRPPRFTTYMTNQQQMVGCPTIKLAIPAEGLQLTIVGIFILLTTFKLIQVMHIIACKWIFRGHVDKHEHVNIGFIININSGLGYLLLQMSSGLMQFRYIQV